MKTQTLNVGLVGYGMAAKTFHAPLIQAAPGLELTSVVSSDADKVLRDLPDVTVHAKLNELLEVRHVDLIVIATPNEQHYAMAKAALAAGKHVVVDKPITVSASEARQLRAQADRSELLLSVFHNRRWDCDFLTVRKLLEQGRLGRVTSFTSRFDRYRPAVNNRWREQHKPGGGIWYDLGPHLLDQAIELFGMPRAILLELASARDGAEVDDDFLALLEYDRLRVTLQASSLVAEPSPRFVVHGTEGSYSIYGLDPQEGWLKQGLMPSEDWGVDDAPGQLTLNRGSAEEPDLVTEEWLSEPGNYPAFYTAVAQTLLHGDPPPVSGEQAVDVMTLLEAGLDSYRQGRWVRLKEGNSNLRRLHARR
ncbi:MULTISPECIES: oxidoreductase [Halomonas]|uniref:Oxidoreductase n=3 Tax=Halomonas TaxID=2745 RepID=A0AAU7KKD1_9GAMM|nr:MULTISPECIES: oxidoreductase [Halomonas]MBR9772406.1 oxidoreductase [Gammaproteobacteria bacterium]MAR73935.1 oxidoreductase [Halomonas sp.]MBR9878430.1 oxidoreductase [Gammaproteobacteria bacterium]MBS8267875.1 oxidoreductase [Halomonas litopenaei]MBY5939708.1 oxidoreductase [Halomonas sp. DP5N14-9]|tara:strand:- start:1943 stop:3034 length:1092 start_codon:yes stop_codon:yes gene_type:complete